MDRPSLRKVRRNSETGEREEVKNAELERAHTELDGVLAEIEEDQRRRYREWERESGYSHVDTKDEHAIYRAIKAGDTKRVRKLLHDDPYLIDTHQTLGALVPIHVAVMSNKPDIVQILLDADTPVDVISNHMSYEKLSTPLARAIELGHIECARILVQAGAKLTLHAPDATEEGRYPTMLNPAIQSLHKEDRVKDRMACLELVVSSFNSKFHEGLGDINRTLVWMLDYQIPSRGLKWKQTWEILLAAWEKTTGKEWPWRYGRPTR